MLLASAAVLGKETVLWAWNQFLDFVSTGAGGAMTLASFPWQNAIASLLALIGSALVLWPNKAGKRASKYDRLVHRSQYLVARLRKQREPQYVRHVIEPLTDVCRDGASTLVMYDQLGFAVPHFTTNEAERIAVAMEHYFSTMFPLLRDGHIQIARNQAADIAEQAALLGSTLNMQEFVDYGL